MSLTIRMFMMVIAMIALPGFAVGEEIVRYQLKDWKAKHIHDAKKAATIEGTLKKLGCELQKYDHNGHIDLKYRCPKWHELKLKTHEEAHKWETWLKAFYFTTEHKH